MAKSKFYDLERDGVTQSLLAMFLTCRQKAKLYLEGWGSKYVSDALTFGSLAHGVLELAYLDILNKTLTKEPTRAQSEVYVKRVEKIYLQENPKLKAQELEKLEIFFALLERMLPLYFNFWSDDFKKIKWVSLEEQFKQDFTLSSGKTLCLRGKKDGKMLKGKESWLLETKTKSMVNEETLIDILPLDLQLNSYTLSEIEKHGKCPAGIVYNIIRKTSLKIYASETVPAFADRVSADIEKRPEFYFIRMEIPFDEKQMSEYKKEFTSLLLDYYEWASGAGRHYKNPVSCESKYGKCAYIGVCANNDYSDLAKRPKCFRELADY